MFEKIKDTIEARRQAAVRRGLWEEAEEKEAAAQNSQGNSPAKPLARSWEPLTKKTEYPLFKEQQQQAAVPAVQHDPGRAYKPLVEIAKSLPSISPAYQLAQNPVFNNRDGAKLYDALNRQLDARDMNIIDSYYARQVEDKLKRHGMKNPSPELTQGLSKAWMSRPLDRAMLDAVLGYSGSRQVLEELLDFRPGLGNMATSDLKDMIGYQHRLAEDTTLTPEDRARAISRLEIYEKEALYGRGMTEEEVSGLKTGGVEMVKLSNDMSDEDEEVMIYATPGPNDKEVTYLGPPPTPTPTPKGYRKPKGHVDLTIGPPAEELINGSFSEGIEKILDYGDQNMPDETLDFEKGIAYAIAYNNATNIKQDERKRFLDGFKEKTGTDFTITEENGIRYDAKSGDPNAAKANRNRCAAYLGGALRAMGMELDDGSLKHIDQLHAELTGGTYNGVTYPPNSQVRGVARLYVGGPLSENGTLSVQEQYERLVSMGVVQEGDAVFVAHAGPEGDLSHGALITKVTGEGIYYSGETTARYNRELSDYFGTNRGTSYVDVVLFFHDENEPGVLDLEDYTYDKHDDHGQNNADLLAVTDSSSGHLGRGSFAHTHFL